MLMILQFLCESYPCLFQGQSPQKVAVRQPDEPPVNQASSLASICVVISCQTFFIAMLEGADG